MKINKPIKNLCALDIGFYKMTDKQYFSRKIEEKYHSQSTWKKIKNKSIRAILKEKEEGKETKAMRIGSAGHSLILEKENFNNQVVVKRDFPTLPKKDEYIRKRIENSVFGAKLDLDFLNKKDFFADRLKYAPLKNRKEIPTQKEFLEMKIGKSKMPEKMPTQKEFLKDAETKIEKERLKKKYAELKERAAKLKSEYLKKKKKIDLEYLKIKREDRKIIDYNKKIEDEIKVEWNKQEIIIKQLTQEWSEAKERLSQAKELQKEKIEIAQEKNLTIINEEELEIINMANRAFFNHDQAAKLHSQSQKEIAGLVYHQESGLYLKVKYDLIDIEKGVIGELKIFDDIDAENFYWLCEKRQLKIQFAIYAWAAEALGVKINEFKIILASKQAEEVAFINMPMKKIKGQWLKEANGLLCQYAKELREYENGVNRYDNEIEFFDPEYSSVEELDEIFKEITAS